MIINKLFLTTFFSLVFSCSLLAQFGTGKLYHETDTSRWFEVMNDRNDQVIAKLHEVLGQPKQSSTGNYLWTNVLIPELENLVSIRVYDGVITMHEGAARFDAFKNEADKNKRLNNLEENESRSTEIRFVDSDNNNVIRSDQTERACRNYLVGITK